MSKIEELRAEAQLLRQYSDMTEDERTAFHAYQDDQATKFLTSVDEALKAEGPVISPERFGQIADQIEAAAPNWHAFLQGVRALGRQYSKPKK